MTRHRHQLRRAPAGGVSARGERIAALALAYDGARRALWQAAGQTFRAMVRAASSGSDFAEGNRSERAFVAAARVADIGFALSRGLDGVARELAAARRARDALVAANLWLVVAFVKQRRDRAADCGRVLQAEYEDMFQRAVLDGLMVACDRFEPERGLAFSTYATPWIRGAILDEERQGPAVRLNGQAICAWVRASELRARHLAETGELLSWQAVAQALGKPARHAAVLESVERALGVDDDEVDEVDDEVDDAGQVDDGEVDSPETALADDEQRRAVWSALARVPAAERAALEGLAGLRPASLDELARAAGVPRSQAPALRRRAIKSARVALTSIR